jgi:hypothetical protein
MITDLVHWKFYVWDFGLVSKFALTRVAYIHKNNSLRVVCFEIGFRAQVSGKRMAVDIKATC